jgi:hypothetical protein
LIFVFIELNPKAGGHAGAHHDILNGTVHRAVVTQFLAHIG